MSTVVAPAGRHAAREPEAGRPESPGGGTERRAVPADQESTQLLPRQAAAGDRDATMVINKVGSELVPFAGAGTGGAGPLTGDAGKVFRSQHSTPASEPLPLDIDVEFSDQTTRKPRGHRRTRRGSRHRPVENSASQSGTSTEAPSKGELVVPLRPVRTEEGYRSVYSELTRVTVRSVILSTSRAIGEGFITFGLIVLLFAAYEIWGVGGQVNEHQANLSDQLAQQWSATPTPSASSTASPPPPMDGAGIARLYVPRLKDKPWVVVQGVDPDSIRYAPGHDPRTAMPGELGNFVVAGHRTPAIFWDLDIMKVGDPVIVETREKWFVYTTTLLHVVSNNGVQILAPVPNQPGVTPTEPMLTLFTCQPKTGNEQRLVLHARLTSSQPHDAGYPPELGR